MPADGIYKIDHNLLRQAGLNPDNIDPRHLQLYTGHVGMLPQANAAARISDVQQMAIEVTGEADGRFNTGDAIFFLGLGTDKIEYAPAAQMYRYSNHLYDDANYVYLTVGDEPGKRITVTASPTGSFPVITTFEDVGFYETERHNILKSGRQWFGEQFDTSPEVTIRFDVPGIVENSTLRFASHVMAQTFAPSSFEVFWNGVSIANQPITPIPNTQYGLKGRVRIDTVAFQTTAVNAASRTTQEIRYRYTKATGFSIGYLDFFSFTVQRRLALYGTHTFFQSAGSTQQANATFQVTGTDANTRVWDVTKPFEVTRLETTFQNGTSTFATATGTLKRFVAFNPAGAASPTFVQRLPNQNVRGASVPHLVIVSHPDFLSEANRLAAHRRSFNGLDVLVVTTQHVYEEFSGGKRDVTALRDFFRTLYLRNNRLENVLLVGRGTYDYKNRITNNSTFVPIYESRNSLSPLETYSSDDYFAFMGMSEGEWPESPAVNHSMAFGVGRLPVRTVVEARDIVNKLIAYDTDSKKVGSWRKVFAFVADDGDFNIHQSQADLLSEFVQTQQPQFDTRKIYLDLFRQENRPSGQRSPQTTEAIARTLQEGVAIVNFTGHGSEQVWMDERVLDGNTIKEWGRLPQWPLFVTATCEFGRHDDPQQITTGERILLQPEGAIGLVTTARPVNASTNFTLNRAFYTALFQKTNGRYRSLGLVFRDTKNTSQSGVANRNFSLLGDPSLTLALGELSVAWDDITTQQQTDTLRPLSQARIRGSIRESGNIQNNFSGKAEVTVFNKPKQQQTKGDENPAFFFSNFTDILYKGEVHVTDGLFEVGFTVPKNVSSTVVKGKLTAYAANSQGHADAAGAKVDIPIGGVPVPVPVDNEPPSIQLFMGDTTYVSGGPVGPRTAIVARLRDASGINLTADPQHVLLAVLDDSLSFELNQHFRYFIDQDKEGLLSYALSNLASGQHQLTVYASDTHLNRTQATIRFSVSEDGGIRIENFVNFPNPVRTGEYTTFQFIHTRPGEDLEAHLMLYNAQGQPLMTQRWEVRNSYYEVTLSQWNGLTPSGAKLPPGIYFAKLVVRSPVDGSQNEQTTRLLLTD